MTFCRSVALVSRTVLVSLTVAVAAPVHAQDGTAEGESPPRLRSPNNPLVSLGELEERRPPGRGWRTGAAVFPNELRTIDGTGNNAAHPEWGSAGIPFLRRTTVGYADGRSTPRSDGLPSAREVSNALVAQGGSRPNARGVSDLVWQWGQFLDHDLDLTPEIDPQEAWDVAVPVGDPWFDPGSTGTVSIPLSRSIYRDVDGVRQQLNMITAFIDASNVYGSDPERARALRALDGEGRLATSADDLLPLNEAGLPNAGTGDPARFFLAGDFRANEQVGLTAMHTLFVREHNFWAEQVRAELPKLSGEEVYQYAKAIVTAEIQAITYREFLPILLGPEALPPYRGYDPRVDPGISNLFASAAYRFGHSMLSSRLLRLDAAGEEIPEGHLSLAEAFFNPAALVATGIEPVLRGLAAQRAQEVDVHLVDEVRNFLFGAPGAGGFDLASLNVQRGREHGLPGFNQVRRDLGMWPHRRFERFHPDPEVVERLRALYPTVDAVDAWVGGLLEPAAPGALVGPTWRAVLADQFRRLRDGDRFWYESYLPPDLVAMVHEQTLARIIRRNTDIGAELSDRPFSVASAE